MEREKRQKVIKQREFNEKGKRRKEKRAESRGLEEEKGRWNKGERKMRRGGR